MKEDEQQKSSNQFLKTDGGKTKSNAIEVPSISLPKGGGAIKGIDEKFSVNAVNGTASFSIPLPVSPARGASPSLSLSYNSGSGNGVFGLGWNLNLQSIKRKTDKGLPKYIDSIDIDFIDSDVFLFSEAEDLVPEFQKEVKKDTLGDPVVEDGHTVYIFSRDSDDNYIINEFSRTINGESFTIHTYKPRIEGLFAKIERWTNQVTSEIKWRVITKDNTTTLFGRWTTTSNSIIADPKDNKRIFEWLPEFVFDDKGNCCQYVYKQEDATDLKGSLLQLHNRNRFVDGKLSYTNLYLERVLYCNLNPYRNFGDTFPAAGEYLFETVFDYGDLIATPLSPDIVDNSQWAFRPDAFSDYKAGFEIRTTRLCKRVLLFHHFKGVDEYDGLVKSLNFEYDTSSEQDFTFLTSITSVGYIKQSDGSYSSKSLPPFTFEYQKHEWNSDVKTVSREALVNAPVGIDEQSYQFVDLFNEGLSGILTEQAGGWYYKHNLGERPTLVENETELVFEEAILVSPKPSFSGLGAQLHLTDLDADGGKQLVNYNEPKGFFEIDDDNEWRPFQNFRQLPNVNFNDPFIRMLDLNGDGKAELVISEDNVFTWYESEGRNGFKEARKTAKPFDEEAGPYMVFADEKQSIFLADMSGDGLTDIVRIRNSEVCYWPNTGYGNFGAKIAMDNAPLLDSEHDFNPAFIKLADIDGSGTTDIIYLGKNKFSCWKNLSGNRFATAPFEISAFPEIHSLAKITVTDLLGNGVACIVWSSPLSKDAGEPLKYIDLMNSRKPHIMVRYANNLGKEVHLTYSPSTRFYVDDKLAGTPWVTKLHFPVHCISETETRDRISGWRFTSAYKYHHGYYDHAEREFRGFGMVEQTDSEDFEHWVEEDAANITDKELHQEPVVTKTWYHTGAFLRNKKILGHFETEYWYQFVAGAKPDGELPDASIIGAKGIDASVVENLSAIEWREALRACKSMALRSEVFAHDAPPNPTDEQLQHQLIPYSVATHNCVIELLQPKGKNKHAVFVVKESESLTYSYERNTADPRIAHNLNLKLDEYGNVLESAAVVYRREEANIPADASFPDATKTAQRNTIIIYTQNRFTNDVVAADVHRLRLPSEVKTFELKNVGKSILTNKFYTLADFENLLTDLKSTEVAYYKLDEPAGVKAQRRLIEHVRTNYRSNNLTDILPLHQLESLALPYQSYQLAYTPELLADIYGSKAVPSLMVEGKFDHSINEVGSADENWWIRSGVTDFFDNAKGETAAIAPDRFFVPVVYTDPYSSKTSVKYHTPSYLFVSETSDAFENKTSAVFNFRTLSPQQMRDINNNLSEVISDELGLVKAMAVKGKGRQADDLEGLEQFVTAGEPTTINSLFNPGETAKGVTDYDAMTTAANLLLKQATVRFVYDFDAYKTGKPAVVASIVRETHHRDVDENVNPDSKLQISFEYSNGLGKVVLKKAQAEPGEAKKVIVKSLNPDGTYNIEIQDIKATDSLRWIGNGKTILNNKGNPVKQYEPYFSATHHYEDFKELVESGVTPVMHYDAMSRLVRTDMPDGTFSKVEFDSWVQKTYDANDTVTESDWYKKRQALPANDPDRIAADKAAAHDNTPAEMHFDTLGRPVLQRENNGKKADGTDILYDTIINVDVEGNLRTVTDARNNVVMIYKYDMLGNKVYQNSMDAGQRWLLQNVVGNPLRTWDERAHEFQYTYDRLHRPVTSTVIGGDGESLLDNVFDRIIYGEDLLLDDRSNEAVLQDINILGKPVRHFDTAGVVTTSEYDFKGQPLSVERKLFADYKGTVNWEDISTATGLEAGHPFTFTTKTDALGRITWQTAPDGSIITPTYNAAGLLESEGVNHAIGSSQTYIMNIDYNEKGQRESIIYGNNVKTSYSYDKETFRLTQLITKASDGRLLQQLTYTYDPVGNITSIRDDAQQVIFFGNTKVEPMTEYVYDALYRLTEAKGREHIGQNVLQENSPNDNLRNFPFAFDNPPAPGDNVAMRNYTQSYTYDEVGNIKVFDHKANGSGYTRNYFYNNNDTDKIACSIPLTTIKNNQLLRTETSSGKIDYQHDIHGNMITMPHLSVMEWNFKDELWATQQTVGANAPTTYYQYDAQGQRVRKITEDSTGKKDERIYIAGYEVYKKHSGTNAGLQRNCLSLMDKEHRFVMIETVLVQPTSPSPSERAGVRSIRYQHHNHLGSASLELDEKAAIISYEEYHPYGTTAYQANNADIKVAAKRYRYTGMERDEETGFSYHRARYYLPWLGRWLSADPIGIKGGINIYNYVSGNPIKILDPDGTDGIASKAVDFFKGYVKGNVTVNTELILSTAQAFETLMKPLPHENVLPILEIRPEVAEKHFDNTLQNIKEKGELLIGMISGPFTTAFEAGENIGQSALAAAEGHWEDAGDKLGQGTAKAAIALSSALELARGVGGIVEKGAVKRVVTPEETLPPTQTRNTSSKKTRATSGAETKSNINGVDAQQLSDIKISTELDGSISIRANEGKIKARFDMSNGNLNVDNVEAYKKKSGVGTELYKKAIEEAAKKGEVKSVTGFLSEDNFKAFRQAGNDVNATPRAKILNSLGFTQHTIDIKTKRVTSTKP